MDRRKPPAAFAVYRIAGRQGGPRREAEKGTIGARIYADRDSAVPHEARPGRTRYREGLAMTAPLPQFTGMTMLFAALRAPLRNARWSWGAQRADGAIFLRQW